MCCFKGCYIDLSVSKTYSGNSMKSYKNICGNSRVAAYELNNGEITVQFSDGVSYLYTTQSTGAVNINEMHCLAMIGLGLNSFINRIVKKNYARKI